MKIEENIWLSDNSTRKFRSSESFAIKDALKARIAQLENQLRDSQNASPEIVKTMEMFLTNTREALFIFENYKITYK